MSETLRDWGARLHFWCTDTLPFAIGRTLRWVWDFLVPWIGILAGVWLAAAALSETREEYATGANVVYFIAMLFVLWLVDLIRTKAVARERLNNGRTMLSVLTEDKDITISTQHTVGLSDYAQEQIDELRKMREDIINLIAEERKEGGLLHAR